MGVEVTFPLSIACATPPGHEKTQLWVHPKARLNVAIFQSNFCIFARRPCESCHFQLGHWVDLCNTLVYEIMTGYTSFFKNRDQIRFSQATSSTDFWEHFLRGSIVRTIDSYLCFFGIWLMFESLLWKFSYSKNYSKHSKILRRFCDKTTRNCR